MLSRLATARSKSGILRYHSVAEAVDRPDLYLGDSLTVSPAEFEQQVRFLARNYTIVPLDDLVERLRKGRKLDRGAVAITFDDGYRDNYERAFPVLRRYQAPATFFLTAGCIENRHLLWTAHLRYLVTVSQVERVELNLNDTLKTIDLSDKVARDEAFRTLVVHMKNIPTGERQELLSRLAQRANVNEASPLDNMMMSWDQMRQMHRHGMSFGAHTVTHPNLPNTSLAEARREIRESKEMIEHELGERVCHFAYPNGRGSSHLTEKIKEVVRETGFHSAVTSFAGCIQGGDDLFELRRVGVYKKHSSLAQLSWDIERRRWKR